MADARHQTSPSLTEQLANVRTADRRCGVLKIMEHMTEDEAAQLTSVLDDPYVSLSDLTRILKSNGFSISDKMLYRHRHRGDGGCGCPR